MTKNFKDVDKLFIRSIYEDDYVLDDTLIDLKANGKEQPWVKHKLESTALSDSYNRLGFYSKSDLVRHCGSYLFFLVYLDGGKKLVKASFCRVRLCPMCAWRRSLKMFGQVSRVMDYLVENYNYKYVFGTFTCKSVTKEELPKQLDLMLGGFKYMNDKDSSFRAISKGWFRSLEVTHDLNEYITSDMWYGNKMKHIYARGDYYAKLGLCIGDKNPQYNTYHPHIHLVLAVDKSYFTNPKVYINYNKWVSIWRKCLGVDYNPVVWLDVIKSNYKDENIPRAVAEISKYAVKAGDYIVKSKNGTINKDLTDEFVSTLDGAFRNRRLVAFGGIFKKVHKLLNLDDTENGDLVHTDNADELRDDINYLIMCYGWNMSMSNYYRMSE